MKKKRASFILLLSAVICIFSVSVSAYMPQSVFSCYISNENIPENTVFVDFLLPISEKKEYYTEFNEINGERYGINKDSEIVNYREDGFMSYTFHLKDARSEMILDNGFLVYFCDEYIYETIDYGYVEEILSEELTEGYTEDYEQIYDFEYCCKEFRYAKMAYIDKNGNVLSVSNKADIYKFTLSALEVDLSLNGNELTSSLGEGPAYWLIPILFFVLPVSFFVILVVGIIFLARYANGNKIVGELKDEQAFYNSFTYTEIHGMNSFFVRGKCLGSLQTVEDGKMQKIKIYKVKNQPDCICVSPTSKFRSWRVFKNCNSD